LTRPIHIFEVEPQRELIQGKRSTKTDSGGY
jgi:hypothetical protein